MNLSSILGKHLKSDVVLRILERFDLQVFYDFDRLHENEPDRYWAAAGPQGFQMRFNAAQELDTVFCYVAPNEGFNPIDPSIIGKDIFEKFSDAEAHWIKCAGVWPSRGRSASS